MCIFDDCREVPLYKRCSRVIGNCGDFGTDYEKCYPVSVLFIYLPVSKLKSGQIYFIIFFLLQDPNSNLVYDWEYSEKDEILYGKKNRTCYCKLKHQERLFTYYMTDACSCVYEYEKQNLNRYFSLQEVTSDVNENKY